MQLNEKALEYFVQLARRGTGGGASGGELRAARLAERAFEDVGGIDQQAAEGFIEFVRVCAVAPQTARRLIRGN